MTALLRLPGPPKSFHALQTLAEEVHDLLQGNSLYLVGMMGSGKTTVGRLVGKALKYPLIDTDALIEQSSRSTVSEVFAEEGEEAFRDMETEVLHVRPMPEEHTLML